MIENSENLCSTMVGAPARSPITLGEHFTRQEEAMRRAYASLQEAKKQATELKMLDMKLSDLQSFLVGYY